MRTRCYTTNAALPVYVLFSFCSSMFSKELKSLLQNASGFLFFGGGLAFAVNKKKIYVNVKTY